MKAVEFAGIGECMIELSGESGDAWHMGFAGDTFNTTFYARATLPAAAQVAYVTAVGDDPFSRRLTDFIAQAGIETDRIRVVAGQRPGLYAITLANGERSFTYWRGQSAARSLADDADTLAASLGGVRTLYFSGITLAILEPDARSRLLAALEARRKAGATIAFDPNYRPALWADTETAREAMRAAYAVADIVMPTFPDERTLFGDGDPEGTAKRLQREGVPEIIIKNGDAPALVCGRDAALELVPPLRNERPVDTTGAGDSFNGAYLAARLSGKDPLTATRLGHAVAAQVIGVHGALAEIDRSALPPD